jgi:bacteriorhodopsin
MALLVGSASYYAQASDLGWSSVKQTDQLTRQIFYARYINWVVSFPALVLSLGLLSGISWTTIVLNIFLAWFWVLSKDNLISRFLVPRFRDTLASSHELPAYLHHILYYSTWSRDILK